MSPRVASLSLPHFSAIVLSDGAQPRVASTRRSSSMRPRLRLCASTSSV